MARAILSSARHGAYIAIGLYVALVLVVSVGAQYQGFVDASLHASVSTVAAERGAGKGAVGA
ncbi:hypothetical protein J3P84_11745 [Pseudomonas sp. Z1-29]|uniref:hypothetical protein n=1 Tax=unclassified Pseudomonas TaxID=196821 RepID=UPI003DA9697B